MREDHLHTHDHITQLVIDNRHTAFSVVYAYEAVPYKAGAELDEMHFLTQQPSLAEAVAWCNIYKATKLMDLGLKIIMGPPSTDLLSTVLAFIAEEDRRKGESP